MAYGPKLHRFSSDIAANFATNPNPYTSPLDLKCCLFGFVIMFGFVARAWSTMASVQVTPVVQLHRRPDAKSNIVYSEWLQWMLFDNWMRCWSSFSNSAVFTKIARNWPRTIVTSIPDDADAPHFQVGKMYFPTDSTLKEVVVWDFTFFPVLDSLYKVFLRRLESIIALCLTSLNSSWVRIKIGCGDSFAWASLFSRLFFISLMADRNELSRIRRCALKVLPFFLRDFV